MVNLKYLTAAFRLPASLEGHKTIESYLKSKHDPDFRILQMISAALGVNFEVITYNTEDRLLTNDSWTEAIEMINRSEVDIVPELFVITEDRTKVVHFSYPFQLYSASFVIGKAQYTPHIFGIFKAFSLEIWLILALFVIVMVALKSMLMKPEHSLADAIFDIISVCLKQTVVIKPQTLSQHILTFNWITGTMLLGLCYTSVFLSFLTFPSMFQIRTMQDLADAVENDGYNCMFDSYAAAVPKLLADSKIQPLVILGENMLSNPNGFGNFEDFLRMRKEKIAYFNMKEGIPSLPEAYYFVSDESVIEGIGGMIVGKDFCCKEQLDVIIHRIMASGLHSKVNKDRAFLSSLKFKYEEDKINSVRKLTLKDFSLAFMILILGYVLSFVVLVVEVVIASLVNRNLEMRKN